MTRKPLSVLFRENDMDDHDVESVAARFRRIRSELPLLSRMPVADQQILFASPEGIEARVECDRGRTLLRYRSTVEGTLFKTFFELPKEDRLLDWVNTHGLAAYVDRVEDALQAPCGGNPAFRNTAGETSRIGVEAGKALDAVLDAALHVIGSSNPSFPRNRAVIVRSPCLGFAGSILDDKSRPLLAKPVETALLSRSIASGVLCRERGWLDVRPVESRGIMSNGHLDPISALRSWADLGLAPMDGRLLLKAGLATS